MLKITFLFLLGIVNVLSAQVKPDSVWMNRKYSMFIHWGLYSQLGGVWDGEPVLSGYSEQIQSHGGIFGDWYADVARDFNPVGWNADRVVELAKKAGMKSIVFTSKHHDGFCMYHSRYTDYNIVDATPYKRDVMKELAEACRRQGMRFGVYFSLIDWHFPQAYPISSHNADPLTPEHYEYNLKQVEEIMTGYGPVSEIWFDMGSLTPEQSRGLYALVSRLQPRCMISGRLGNDCSDFSVMADNEYPDYKMGVPWQTAASFFPETWGYRSWQQRGEAADKVNEKIKSLIKVVSRGGNYLLNIGPMGDGGIVPFEEEVLLGIGAWLDKYGEAIYGTKANPFDYFADWGDITAKGNNLYLFVEGKKRPERILLEGLKGKIKQAVYVGGKPLKTAEEKGTWAVYPEPEDAPEAPVEVIRVELEEGFEILPLHGFVTDRTLTCENAVPLYAYSSMDYYTGFRSIIAYSWGIRTSAKQLKPAIFYTEEEQGKKIVLTVDDTEKEFVLEGGKKQHPQPSKIKWGDLYRKRSGGLLGSIPEVELINGRPAGEGWQLCENWQSGEKWEIPAGERRSFLFWQEIEADRETDAAVEIGSGNGVMVLLNGQVLTTHSAGRGNGYNKEKVLLPLKKGKNILLIKTYNRFEKTLCFSLRPLENFPVYRLETDVRPLKSRSWHTCGIRLANPETRNSAIRLNNLKIRY